MPHPLWPRAALVIALALAACAAPPPGEGGDPRPDLRGPVTTDERVGTLQLYRTGDEASLPVIALGRGETLTLEFDLLDAKGPRQLDVSVRRVERDGAASALLPGEYLTGFERDAILDADASGATALPYTHFRYTFPNQSIGFRLGGQYVLRVEASGGAPLFELPFFVSEDLVQTEVEIGSRLAERGAIGEALQPAARLRPSDELSGVDASRYTVCFARNGALDDLRCAPEPSLAELAVFGFYLPADQAFDLPGPLFSLDLGQLGVGREITEIDYAAIPPEALMEPDFAAFGGEINAPALVTTSGIDAGYRDAGRGDDDADYVRVLFRYVPVGEREVPGPVYVRGGFTGGALRPSARLTWNAEARRYEGSALVKQGLYAYDYVAPQAPPRQRPTALGQPTVFTAFVFYEDLTRFAERLVGVQTVVAR